MRMEHHDYSEGAWKYRPRFQKRGADGALVLWMAALIGVLVTLMIGHVVVKAIAKAAAYNVGMDGGW